MLRSLVGSEMCIRDSSNRASPTPTGSTYLVSGGNTPASGTRGPHPGYGSNASMTTPSKNGGRWDVDSPSAQQRGMPPKDLHLINCLLYTSDAADEEESVDLGGRRITKKKTANLTYELRSDTKI
eukprot:TRINITY_DN35785_c0_g1_i1.p1 TRINITY_DN35785_c0_g1~~TRINITY_DN35785_c0_g1_i1.p1  ORF type:complete len:125 (+),score=33.62 TRINITY_DN35785_c0_g1_i1:94-468(+)